MAVTQVSIPVLVEGVVTEAELVVALQPKVGSIDTIQELRDSASTASAHVLLGHTTVGDGGGGTFTYYSGEAPATFVDDDGMTIVPTGGDGSAGWLREYGAEVDARWFGCTGVADDVAINAASAFCTANNKILVGSGDFYGAATVSILCDCNMKSADLYVDATAVNPGLRVGPVGSDKVFNKKMVCPAVMNTARVATQFGTGVGIECSNLNTCEVTVPRVTEFYYGLRITGYLTGNAYNVYNLGFIYSNVKNVHLTVSDTGGWCNQNTFMGGRLGINTGDFTGTDYTYCTAIRLDKGSSSYGGPNNHTFIGTSMESDLIPYMMEWIESVAYNTWLNCRFEGTSNKILLDTDTASGIVNNTIIGGYQAHSLTFTPWGAGSNVYNQILGTRLNKWEGTGAVHTIVNTSGNTEASPHVQGFIAGAQATAKDQTDTDWTYRIYSAGISGKKSTDTYSRLTNDYTTGRVLFGVGTSAPLPSIGPNSTGTGMTVKDTVYFIPSPTNTVTLGSSTALWSVVYAGTATINTSDERVKADIESMSDVERLVALELKGAIKKFKFKDAIAIKGDSARIHVGIIAQEVESIFKKHGLDGMEYGILCYDEWDEHMGEEGEMVPAGNRYGVRYTELIMFILGAI